MRFRATVELHGKTATGLVVPDDVVEGLAGLAPSHREEWVRWVEDAKRPETRQHRLEQTVAALREGRRSR